MTTLTDLIDAVRAARATESWRDLAPEEAATERLIDYVLTRAAAFAARERLERAVVEAWQAFNAPYETWTDPLAHDTLGQAQNDLAAWLVAHADDGAAT